MENVKILLETGLSNNVDGIFYVFNSKYYFIYTEKELEENDYIKLYVVQVCKEIQNTQEGPIETGYMLGMEISDTEEWIKVQESITKIVDDKKNNTQNPKIQYLPISMLINLKIVSKNKFKLMRSIVEDDFNVIIEQKNNAINNINTSLDEALSQLDINDTVNDEFKPLQDLSTNVNIIPSDNLNEDKEVIIDYRTKFFEEQEKNSALEEQLRTLTQKLENIKNIIG